MVSRKVLSLFMVFTAAAALVFVAVSLQHPEVAMANSNDLNIAVGAYPNIANTGLDSCALCHTSTPALNVYGQAYLSHGRSAAALKAIENLDSDQDGFSNITEINALSFPGDPLSLPLATLTATPTATSTPTGTLTATQTPTPFATSGATATATETGTPGATEAATDTPEATLEATDTPEATFAATDTPEATLAETDTPTPEATLAATDTPTPEASATATQTATPAPTAAKSGTPATVVLTPQADAFVSRSHPHENYGAQKTLRIDQEPANRAYLRFDLSGVDLSQVEKVELRVYVTDSSNRGFQVRAVQSNHWDEKTIDFSNAPDLGEVIGRSGEAEAGKWITVDLTGAMVSPGDRDHDGDHDGDHSKDEDDQQPTLISNNQVSLALLGSSENGLSIASRESGDNAPQLIFTMKK